MVKQFLREASGMMPGGSRHLPVAVRSAAPVFGKPSPAIRPGEAELARNPRARSATLRWAIRSDAPARNPGELAA
jgi:16S rRNA (cytosine1402-N4)-methyltransferase